MPLGPIPFGLRRIMGANGSNIVPELLNAVCPPVAKALVGAVMEAA